MKTLVIGLDGATWRFLDPLLDEGSLPNIQSLLDSGVKGNLQSTTPPLTPPAWTSISTGVSPGTHGVHDFLELNRETYQLSPTTYSKMTRPAIWDLFEREGHSIGVVNFPMAYPPRKVGSFFVSGPPIHESENIGHPPKVNDILESVNYRVDPERRPSDGVEAFYNEIQSLTESQLQATLQLMEQYNPELLWTVFMGIDRIQHYLWDEQIDGENAVEQFYKYMDTAVGSLIQAASDDVTVCVLSDHGARRIEKRVNVNTLLSEWGYLEQAKPGLTSSLKQALVNNVWSAATSFPRPVKSFIREKTPTEAIARFRSKTTASTRSLSKFVDWEQTEAFAVGNGGGVFVHGQDFEHGPVPDSGYEELRDELISEFTDVKDPETGEPIFEEATRTEELYPTVNERTPDITLQPKEWKYTAGVELEDERLQEPGDRVADHEPTGVFILSGDEIRGSSITCDAVDITPTLLYLHDLPTVETMEGEIRSEIFTEAVTDDRQRRTIPVFSPEHQEGSMNEEKVEERLQNLGYL
ncbi:alkaline phosphatase family protein [Halorussus amylolyticus]|uniref:alkaline phosphatase family protein n=1 Tax=Halorussus amylolyticus TaxID=1126242 RepID=UPI001047CAC4|nr:alkaline phosphatase family protein [Halorussus amylolyticus]